MNTLKMAEHIENQAAKAIPNKSHPSGQELAINFDADQTSALKSPEIKRKMMHKANSRKQVNEKTFELISFRVLNEVFGIEMLQLQEILKSPNIVRVPRSAEHLKGILNLRGNLISVIDLQCKMGLGKCVITHHSRVLIVQHQHLSIGLLVDQVKEIIHVNEKWIKAVPSGLSSSQKKWLKNIVEAPEGVILLPELTQVFALEDEPSGL